DDAASAEETDWPQILAWYDDLVALADDPVHQDPAAVLGRAVAVGHVLGPAAGLRETDRLREVLGDRHRWHAVRGHLHELEGDLPAAAAAAFFVELGLEVQGEGSVEGDEVGSVVGLEGVHTRFAMVQTSDGHSRLELIEFVTPAGPPGDRRAPSNTPGLRHITFAVDDLDAVLARVRAAGA